jgi:Immunity protein 8
MKATVRRLHSPDVDLESFAPEDPEDFGLLVQLMVGPADGPGEESFDIVVCTPGWLARSVRNDGPLVGLHHLVVERYDPTRVRLYLTALVEEEEASTWPELALKINRIAKWEFADYRS